MADLPIAIAVDIELEALQLNYRAVRDIIDDDGSEIREARARTETGKLGNLQVNDVVALGVRIRPGFQAIGGNLIQPVASRHTRLLLLFTHRRMTSTSSIRTRKASRPE